jgi:ABC-type transporter MlaC component
MSEGKKFPTPAMLKAREEWAKKSPEEREAIETAFREKLRKYYSGTMSFKHKMGMDEGRDE